MNDAREKIAKEISAYLERRGVIDASVCFDTGLSQELYGQTRLTVRDLATALDLPLTLPTGGDRP